MNDENKTIAEEINIDPEFKKQLKELVLERVKTMPDTLKMAIGPVELAKKELLEHVQNEDEVGKQIMELELEFLRDLASGAVYGNE